MYYLLVVQLVLGMPLHPRISARSPSNRRHRSNRSTHGSGDFKQRKGVRPRCALTDPSAAAVASLRTSHPSASDSSSRSARPCRTRGHSQPTGRTPGVRSGTARPPSAHPANRRVDKDHAAESGLVSSSRSGSGRPQISAASSAGKPNMISTSRVTRSAVSASSRSGWSCSN